MKNTACELHEIISDYELKINALSELEFSVKPFPNKWSKKEVVGHLIDSAQNNLRRFVCGQYETQPPTIVYHQDFWVKSMGYQHMSSKDVIQLWKLLNFRICEVLANMSEANYKKECNTGGLHTLEWLATDYVKHLKHHLNQIISGSFDVIYT